MNQSFKQTIKRSSFAIACVRAVRAARMDLQRLIWTLRRGAKIRAYLQTQTVRKLQIGTMFTPFPNWLNTDIEPVASDSVFMDATRPFPIPDATFDYIVCEHMIEHIDQLGSQVMLSECHRILKPGGKIRLTTPDVQVIAGLCAPKPSPEQKKYIDWIIGRFMPDVKECRGAFVLNNAFRAWGHQFLYDADTLKLVLTRAGFGNFQDCKPGESGDPNLRGLESHGKFIGNEEINQYESFVVEAQKI